MTFVSNEIRAIFISPAKGEPMQPIYAVRAIAGIGLEGDRYALKAGAYSGVRIPDEDRAITLISFEAFQVANGEFMKAGFRELSVAEARRNIVMQDMDPDELNSLVGKRFMLGEVELEGSELCDPCARPANVLKRGSGAGKAFEQAFQQRGGLRARILTDGSINEGDKLVVLQD